MTIEPAVQGEIDASLTRAPKRLKGVRFVPWVGKTYQIEGFMGRKVLVLGESHYHSNEEESSEPYWTCLCVAEQVATSYRSRFWTGIAKAFLGKIPDLTQRQTFWQSVAFYNYVQEVVGGGPRIRPTPKMWKSAETGFQSVLDALQPDVVVALGWSMWSWLPHEAVHSVKKKVAGVAVEVCGYRCGENKIATTISLPHPSSVGFNGATWYSVLKHYIVGRV